MSTLSLPKDKIKILLLEGIHENAVASFNAAGYQNVELLAKALDEDELIERIKDVHMVGIRSRTRITEKVIAAADKLFCVGCFCIGTNQVALKAAKLAGVPVFNAPYSNTRSVAELVIAEAVLLMRGIPEKAAKAKRGEWMKTAAGANEVRGKVMGLVGYGHIGSQVSVLAEAMGMQVRFFDVIDKLPLGNARSCASLDELLEVSDVVSLHVPSTPHTKNMIGEAQIRAMRKGSYLINLARGNVVDIDALAAALSDGHIAGTAIDVFPKEPASANEEFVSPLRAFDNVILTPHIGGSTFEAQANIGLEVADKLIKYSDNGSTLGAVNFPELSLPVHEGMTRFMHIHRNGPGVLVAINEVFSERKMNISGQYLLTDPEMGYVVVDVDATVKEGMGIRRDLAAIDGTIRTRFLR